MKYYNYLTTPSGKKFTLYEIENKEYLVLLKFLNGDNFKGFFDSLNELIKKSIPEFDSLDICDKAYTYIAYYYYSIKSQISVKADKFDSVDVPLTIVLNSLEEYYKKDFLTIDFYKWKNCIIGYPTLLDITEDSINIDYSSALREINGLSLSEEQKRLISKNAPLKDLAKLEVIVKHNYSSRVYFAKDIIGTKDIYDDIINPAVFYSIAYMYKESLEHFYNMLYLVCHYIRVQWDSLLDMTPVEMMILYNNFVEDKENQAKNSKKHSGKGINVHDPNIADSLIGY